MNYCMNKNLWLLLDSNDPADELLWLIFELQLAELKGEKVSHRNVISTVPNLKGDPKYSERGPKGDLILSKKGT